MRPRAQPSRALLAQRIVVIDGHQRSAVLRANRLVRICPHSPERANESQGLLLLYRAARAQFCFSLRLREL